MALIADIISVIGALVLAYSSTRKTKLSIFCLAALGNLCCVVGAIMVGAHTGAATCLVACICAYLSAKDELPFWGYIASCIVCISIGLFANAYGLIGWLPIIASCGYRYIVMKSKDVRLLKAAITVNMFVWCIYDVGIHLYLTCAFDSVTATIALISTIKQIKKEKSSRVGP